MRRLPCATAAVLVALAACTVPETPPPARLAVWRDDGGLRAGLVSTEDSGIPGPDAGLDRLVRSSPARNRDLGICSPDHFCWENPLPQGAHLYGVWAAKDDEVWAVGAAGTLLRFDGKAWTRFSTKVATPLTALWGAGPESGWAVGPGALLRYDGKGWQKQEALAGATLLVWGTAADDVWAAGSVLHHWDGTSWAAAAVDGAWSVVALAGLSANDVWAVARNEEPTAKGQGLLLRFNGKAWTRSALPFALAQASLAVISPKEAYLATDQGVLARFDGKAWKKVADLGSGERPVLLALPEGGVEVAGPGRKWGRFAGGAWTKSEADSPALRGLWTATKQAWGVGDRGLIVRRSGQAWERAIPGSDGDLRAVDGTGADDLWTVGDQGLALRRNEKGEWRKVETGSKSRLNGVWAAGPDDVWIVGDSDLLHWDGQAFASKWEPAMGPLKAVVGRGSKDVYVAGDNGVRRFNGTVWQNVDAPAAYPLNALATTGDGAVWALGDGGMVRFDGHTWTEVGASKENAPSVLFGGPYGPHVAGKKGVWRYDGKGWASVISGVEITAGWSASSDDVWALAKGEEVRQWNGVGWRKMASGATGLSAVWSKTGEAFVVGEGGAILHYRP
ncbi:MAG TPA: hypothetical protein VGK67_15785 [Myxococcales bacterium]|jgi:hypothetical protein